MQPSVTETLLILYVLEIFVILRMRIVVKLLLNTLYVSMMYVDHWKFGRKEYQK